MSADYLSADYSCIMVNYVKGSKAVGDSHHRTVVKAMFARYSRMVDFSVAVAL